MSQPARTKSERPAALVPVREVDDGATVRHFDQLSERAQEAITTVAAGGVVPAWPSELSRGDVVVFTQYYRIS